MALSLVQKVAPTGPQYNGTASGTFASPTTTGNILIVGLIWYDSTGKTATISTVSDGTNAFTIDTNSHSVVANTTHYGQLNVQFAYAVNITGKATDAITVNFSSTDPTCTLFLWEVSPGQYDQSSKGTGSGSALASASLTPSANGAFACALGLIDDGIGRTNDFTAGTGWTIDAALGGGNSDNAGMHIAQATAATLTGNMTCGDTGSWVAGQIIFVPAGGPVNATVNAKSAQIRLRAYGASVSTVTPVNKTVQAPSAQLRLRSASPAVLSTSSALSGPSAQIRLRSSAPTVTTGSSASITAASAQLRVRSAAPSVNTTSGKSIQAPSAQLRVRTGTPKVASSSSLHGTSAQIRLRSHGITVFASAAIPEICNPTALILTSNASTLLLTGRDTTMALTGPADTSLTVDSDDASTLTLTIC